MIFGSVGLLSLSYVAIVLGMLLLVVGYYYRGTERARYARISGIILFVSGLSVLIYFVLNFT